MQGKINAGGDVFDYPRVLIVPVVKSEREARGMGRLALPDDNGVFEVTAAPGEYYVCFYNIGPSDEPWADWYKRQTEGAVKVTITEGETTKITINLPKK